MHHATKEQYKNFMMWCNTFNQCNWTTLEEYKKHFEAWVQRDEEMQDLMEKYDIKLRHYAWTGSTTEEEIYKQGR